MADDEVRSKVIRRIDFTTLKGVKPEDVVIVEGIREIRDGLQDALQGMQTVELARIQLEQSEAELEKLRIESDNKRFDADLQRHLNDRPIRVAFALFTGLVVLISLGTSVAFLWGGRTQEAVAITIALLGITSGAGGMKLVENYWPKQPKDAN